MNNLSIINNVRVYLDENGTAQLNLEDVARGLGFTNVATSGHEVVRWARVSQYLSEIGFSQEVGKDGYIPENIFYRLAFKAKNETAEKFQALVADEILPAIRRTGSYQARPMSQIEILAQSVQQLVLMDKRVTEVESDVQQVKTSVDKALDILSNQTFSDWQTSTNSKVREICKNQNIPYSVLFGNLYKELESTAHVNLKARVSRLQERLKKSGSTYKERQAVSKLHVVSMDPKLKSIFDGIVRRQQAQYEMRVC